MRLGRFSQVLLIEHLLACSVLVYYVEWPIENSDKESSSILPKTFHVAESSKARPKSARGMIADSGWVVRLALYYFIVRPLRCYCWHFLSLRNSFSLQVDSGGHSSSFPFLNFNRQLHGLYFVTDLAVIVCWKLFKSFDCGLLLLILRRFPVQFCFDTWQNCVQLVLYCLDVVDPDLSFIDLKGCLR